MPSSKQGTDVFSTPVLSELLLTVLLPDQDPEQVLCVVEIILDRILELLASCLGKLQLFSPGTPRQNAQCSPGKRSLPLFFTLPDSCLLPSPCSSKTSGFGGTYKHQPQDNCELFKASDIFHHPRLQSFEFTGIFSQMKPDQPVSSWYCISIPH